VQDRLLRPARSCHLDHPLGPALNADSLDALREAIKHVLRSGAGEDWRADEGRFVGCYRGSRRRWPPNRPAVRLQSLELRVRFMER
jgi:hypothetical protein